MYKKPPGILSAHSVAGVCGRSILEAFKVIKKERERGYNLKKKGGGKEMNIESSTRRRIFRVWLRSMGLARVDCLMNRADGMLHR